MAKKKVNKKKVVKSKGFDIVAFCEYVIDSEGKEENLLRDYCINTKGIDKEIKWKDLTSKEKNTFKEKVFYCDNCTKWKEVDERYETDGNGDMCESCYSEYESKEDVEAGKSVNERMIFSLHDDDKDGQEVRDYYEDEEIDLHSDPDQEDD